MVMYSINFEKGDKNMKKLTLALSAIFLLLTLTACGFVESGYQKNGGFDTTANTVSQTMTEASASNQTGPLTLTVVGENKLLVTLTDKRVDGFSEVDETDTNQKTFRMYFFAGEQQKISISMTPHTWDISGAEDMSEGSSLDFYINCQEDPYQISGDTISFEVNQSGIANYFSQCDNYRIYYFDNNGQQEEVAGGDLTDIVNTQASSETIKITYIDDDQAIVRVAGETFDRYLKGDENHELTLEFYLPGIESYTPLYELRISSGVDYLSTKLCQLTLRQDEGIMDSQELTGDQNNMTVRTDNGYSAQIFYGGIESLLSSCDRIVVTADEGKALLTESYENTVINGQAAILPIPDVFEMSAKDEDYFYPITEDYIVIMADMPMSTVLDYGYGEADGEEYYAPINAHEAPLKFISIISYDEFGIADQRTKIIYDSVTSAMTAAAGRLDWYPVSQLTGDEDADNDILVDYMESLDQNTFGSSTNDNEDYEYFGHYDNVRYFAASMHEIRTHFNAPPVMSYDQSTSFGPDGFLTDSIEYKYDFPNFEINLSEMRNSTATITVYSSKAANE